MSALTRLDTATRLSMLASGGHRLQQVASLQCNGIEGLQAFNEACDIIGLSTRTLQRWRQPEELQTDGRLTRSFTPANALSAAELAQVIATANCEEFKQLTPHQIVLRLAERGEYIASESTFYRILKTENQLAHRQASQVPRPASKPKALSATAPNQLYN